MIILGLNAFHADSAAAIIVDGKLVAAAEEERFRRIKHWAGIPTNAIMNCLDQAGISLSEVDFISLNRNPKSNIFPKLKFLTNNLPSYSFLIDRLSRFKRVGDIATQLGNELNVDSNEIQPKIRYIEHHRAHMASAFFVSQFKNAAVVSVDGVGDFVSTMWGIGKTNKIETLGSIHFPHSLGFFYLAITQLLGFNKCGDEYKVMGLAAFGQPKYLDKMREIVILNNDGSFKLDLKFFRHHRHQISMEWTGGEPKTDPIFSDNMEKFLCPARNYEEPILPIHENIAASLQGMYEEALFNLLNHVYAELKCKNLCLAGGCAMNSVANGKIFDNTPFEEIYIQPAAGDAGGAIGAAFYTYNQLLQNPRSFVLEQSYYGKEFDERYIINLLSKKREALDGFKITKISNTNNLCREVAKLITEGNIIGWFQGKMEWGPRALGNRSIVVDPRRAKMKDVLNERIKRREAFRPFAPSILLENVGEYFELDYPDPFMIKVYPIRPEKRSEIPAVTHVDGTGRLQTVRKEDNPIYWQLIKEFEILTGVPVVLNTSFNENEPIVQTPEEALDCYLRTKMDVLVINNYLILKNNNKNKTN